MLIDFERFLFNFLLILRPQLGYSKIKPFEEVGVRNSDPDNPIRINLRLVGEIQKDDQMYIVVSFKHLLWIRLSSQFIVNVFTSDHEHYLPPLPGDAQLDGNEAKLLWLGSWHTCQGILVDFYICFLLKFVVEKSLGNLDRLTFFTRIYRS